MSVRHAPESSLRLDRLESTRLAWAFGISLALHLLCYGGYVIGEKTGLWRTLNLSTLTAKTPAESKAEQQSALDTEPPLIFVEVSPQSAPVEPPKNARYYSDRNSQAANPDPPQDSHVPRITGTQTEIPKTEDVPRPRPEPLQPSPPMEPAPVAEEKTSPPGDLALMKPNANLRPESNETPRPRTLAQVQPAEQQLPGRKMRQDGGAARPRLQASFDARATSFGAYDRMLIDIIQSRWYSLLDQVSFHGYRHGRVVLQFRLNYDGRITDMKVVNQNVGEMLSLMCQKAVLDPAPYDKWPQEMRRKIGADYREVTFTFLYD